MSMVGGLDLHRRQITYDVVDVKTGECWRGRLWQPDRTRFRHWLQVEVADRARGETVALAVEGCTGWRYVVEEISAAGFTPFLAEPADTQAARGKKRRAKTDRTDAQLLEESCCKRATCPRAGSRPTRSSSGASGSVSTSRSSTSGRSGVSGSMRCSTTTASRCPKARSARTRPVRCWPATTSSSRARRGSASTRPTRWSTPPTTRRSRSSMPSSASAPASRRAAACRRPIWDRGAVGGRALDRARRLPSLLSLRASGAPQRSRRHGRRLGPSASGWVLVAPGPETLRWALYEAAKNSSHRADLPTTATTPRSRSVTTGRSLRSRCAR